MLVVGDYGVAEVGYEEVDRVFAQVGRDERDCRRGREVDEILEYALSPCCELFFGRAILTWLAHAFTMPRVDLIVDLYLVYAPSVGALLREYFVWVSSFRV